MWCGPPGWPRYTGQTRRGRGSGAGPRLLHRVPSRQTGAAHLVTQAGAGGRSAEQPGPAVYIFPRKSLILILLSKFLIFPLPPLTFSGKIYTYEQVVLVTGDTGSGKTTQVVQYLLEEATHNKQTIRMICCQPRRLTAVTVAERIAAERGEKVGGTIGYQIRLESSVSTRTLATFCTYGVLLRSLCGGLEILESLTHIIIDEGD